MEPRSHNPDSHPDWDDLPDVLRAAVVQIREEPVPVDARQRALANARQIGQSPPPRPRVWPSSHFSLLFTGAVAAALIMLLAHRPGTTGPRLVSRPHPDPDTLVQGTHPNPHAFGQGSDLVQGRWHNPTGDLMPMTVGQLARNWSAWDHAHALRVLIDSPSKPIRDYVRYSPSASVWRQGSKPLAQGQVVVAEGKHLPILGVYVQVVIEGPRARTLVDHIFSNPTNKTVVGTFECSLPEGSSLSHLTTFPGQKGTGQRIQPNCEPKSSVKTLPAPERFVRRISSDCWGEPCRTVVVRAPKATDPVVQDPMAFAQEAPAQSVPSVRSPVGKISPGAFFRVVVAYEETLPIHQGKLVYRLRLPTAKLPEVAFSLQVPAELAKNSTLSISNATTRNEGGQVIRSRTWRNEKAPNEVRFEAKPHDASMQSTSGMVGSGHYLFTRLRPNIPVGEGAAFARHAVFVLDTSAAENPQRFDRCVKLMAAVLEKDLHIEQFNVLTFSTGAAWLEPTGWLANTKANREKALAKLDGIALEGATDLTAALDGVAKPAWKVADDVPIHAFLLSDGQSSWGDANTAALAARFESRCPRPVRWHCYRTDLAEENVPLFELLTRRGGGVYRLSKSEDIRAVSLAHQRRCLTIDRLRFEGGPIASDVLVAGRRAALPPGGELLVGARFAGAGKTTLILEGTLDGKKVKHTFPIEVGDEGELAARAWGELAVASLLDVNDPSLERLAIACGRTFQVASRVTSFAFAQPGPTPATVGVAVAVERGWSKRGEEEADGARDRVRLLLREAVPTESARREVQALFQLTKAEDFPWPTGQVKGGIVARASLPAKYLNPEEMPELAFLEESIRRSGKDVSSGILALSGLVERSSDRTSAALLVAYHVIGMGQPEQAIRLLLGMAQNEPHDPAIHRALGVALMRSGRPIWAALHYESALALLGDRGGWFRAVRSEYANLLSSAKVDPRFRDHFQARRKKLEEGSEPAELRVIVTWNTVASTVELDVLDTNGKAAATGVWVTKDRQGPRIYEIRKVMKDDYRIEARLTRSTPETTPETLALVEVIRHAGTKQESRKQHVLLLRKVGESVRVAGEK